MLAEQLANAMACQGMLWQTSPAATEIEQVMVGWLRGALGLAGGLCRHDPRFRDHSDLVCDLDNARAGDGIFKAISKGCSGKFCAFYASAQTHSSVDKAIRVAGIGQDNLVKVATDASFSMQPEALGCGDCAPIWRRECCPQGWFCVRAAPRLARLTGLRDCIAVAKAHGLPVHVDAAWAGSAMICPEFRGLVGRGLKAPIPSCLTRINGWACSLIVPSSFCVIRRPQVKTLGLRPTYLETAGREEIVNFNEWTVPLGRRFRALKLWFTLRAYGLEGLRARIRNHVQWAQESCTALGGDARCEDHHATYSVALHICACG